jgi:putative DNA-invertase from lambdoid prophage Rac
MSRKKTRVGCILEGRGTVKKTVHLRSIRTYANLHGWELIVVFENAGSPEQWLRNRLELLDLAKNHKIDIVIVSSLDQWAISLTDFTTTLDKLLDTGARFISIAEDIDLDYRTGPNVINLLKGIHEVSRLAASIKIKTGISKARKQGYRHGRPITVGKKAAMAESLFAKGLSKAEIARRLKIGRTSVRRFVKNMKES